MQQNQQDTEVRTSTAQEGNTTVERQSVSSTARTPGVQIAQRIVWFVAGAIAIIIALRFALLLFGANQAAGFTDFIYGLSGVFVAPFNGIFGTPVYGRAVFDVSSLLAIAVYLLAAFGITKLIAIGQPRE